MPLPPCPGYSPKAGEHSEKYDSPFPRLLIPYYNITLWNASHTEALQSITLRQGKTGTCYPFPPSTAHDFGTTKNIYIYIFVLGGGEGVKKQPLYWALFSGSFLFHRVKEDFEEIKVVWKNPGVVALYVVMGRRDEVKCEGPSHPPSCLRLCPGTLGPRKRHFHSCFLGLLTAT